MATKIDSAHWHWFEEYLIEHGRTERTTKEWISKIRKDNFDTLAGFRQYLAVDRKLSKRSVQVYMDFLSAFEQFYHLDIKCFDTDALRSAVEEMTPLYAMHNHTKAIRHWYRYITKEPDLRLIRDFEVKALLRSPTKSARRLSDKSELLTIDNIVTICTRSHTMKWAAIWAICWDLGLRPSEVCNIRHGDVKCDEMGYYLKLRRAKSGRMESHYLMTWISFKYFLPYWRQHPGNDLLFRTNQGKQIYPDLMKSNIRQYRKHLKKRLYSYLIRESAGTWWYTSGLLDIQSCKKRLGHKPDSIVFERHYLMLFQDDYNNAVMKAQGADVPEKDPYIQMKCVSCYTVNPPDTTECFYCRAVLTKEDEDRGRVVESYELQEENERLKQELEEKEKERDAKLDEYLDRLIKLEIKIAEENLEE